MTHVPLSMTKTFLFYPQNVIFQNPGPFYPRNCSAESLEKFRPNRGGCILINVCMFFLFKKLPTKLKVITFQLDLFIDQGVIAFIQRGELEFMVQKIPENRPLAQGRANLGFDGPR
jgi:hypothetical protein